MDVILNELLDEREKFPIGDVDRLKCSEILEEALQSNTKNYEEYFSSKPCSGSIVEEIAELDAHISVVEKKLKNLLVDKQEVFLNDLLNDNSNKRLNDIQDELEQLWEVSTEKVESSDMADLSVEEFLEQEGPAEKQDDQFHMALKTLKERSTREDDNQDISGNWTVVLENLNNVTDIMELPFLARTCIRTGHYQEAVMLYTYSKSLLMNFPNSSIVQGICANVSNETTTTMLTGLVKLLSTNVTVISLKKILNYLVSIPPFDSKKKDIVLQVFLRMRFQFISNELDSFPLEKNCNNESLVEMMVKRKIEVLREHVHMSLSVFTDNFQFDTVLLHIAPHSELGQETHEKPTATNQFMLEFICKCVNRLLHDLTSANLQGKLGESVCLQLVYCSFRLHDLNYNYHSLFLNKIHESNLFSIEALKNSIEKRRELQFKYS